MFFSIPWTIFSRNRSTIFEKKMLIIHTVLEITYQTNFNFLQNLIEHIIITKKYKKSCSVIIHSERIQLIFFRKLAWNSWKLFMFWPLWNALHFKMGWIPLCIETLTIFSRTIEGCFNGPIFKKICKITKPTFKQIGSFNEKNNKQNEYLIYIR